MSKTPLFKNLTSLLARSLLLCRRPELASQIDFTSRREFLKASGVVVATGIIAPPFAHELLSRKWAGLPQSGQEPVIIVGGGLAGLTAAYRLGKAGFRCELYEGSSRMGGRVFTLPSFNRDPAGPMFCELGGELIDLGHSHIRALAAELGIPLDDFRAGDLGFDKLYYHSDAGKTAGGRSRYFEQDIVSAFLPLARQIQEDQQGLILPPMSGASSRSFTAKAVAFDRVSLAEYLYTRIGSSRVEKWVLDLISAAYTGEYGLEPDQQSSLNLLLLISSDTAQGFQVFGESDESARIRGGNSALIQRLTAELHGLRDFVSMHLSNELVRLRERGSRLELTFTRGSGTSTSQVLTSNQVICALPFSVLRGVEGISELALSPRKLQAITTLGYGTNSKQILGFKERVWRKPIKTSDREIPPGIGSAFTDLSSQGVWETSRAQPGRSGILTSLVGGCAGLQDGETRRRMLLDDLGKIYPGIPDSFDGHSAFFAWTPNRLAKGSYICPTPGQYTTIMSAVGTPELGERLLFAGEHTSESAAGFMEGAVESGNTVAHKIIARFHAKTDLPGFRSSGHILPVAHHGVGRVAGKTTSP